MSQEIVAIAPVVGEAVAGFQDVLPRPSVPRGRPMGDATTQPPISASLAQDAASLDLGTAEQAFGLRLNVGVTYEIDRETKSVIIKVIDRDTKQVLRQIPPEEMVKLRSVLRDLFGLLFDAEV